MKSAVIFYHKNIKSIYNIEWINECIDSIKNQSYQEFDVFELNYGEDNIQYCNNIKIPYLYYNIPFINHIDAMNFIISEIFNKGYDVIFNINMDDHYHEKRFEKQIEKIKEGYQLVSSNFYYVSDHKNIIYDMNMTSYKDIGENLNRNHNVIAHPVVCIHKSFWDEDLHYKNLLGFEDLDLWQRAYHKGKKMIILNDYLLYYRIHQNQITKIHPGK